MTIHYAPSITPNNYLAIAAICGDRLPATYWVWRKMQDEKRRALVANGDTVVAVGVDPADLQAFCKATECPPDETSLGILSAKLASERKIEYPFTPSGNAPRRTSF